MPEVVALDASLLLKIFLRSRQRRSDPLRSNPFRSGRQRGATCRAEADETENYVYSIALHAPLKLDGGQLATSSEQHTAALIFCRCPAAMLDRKPARWSASNPHSLQSRSAMLPPALLEDPPEAPGSA